MQAITDKAHEAKAKVCVATDLLALTQLTPPGEWGADIVIGSAQRFGVPMGYGGPHAAFLACHEEYKRLMPGRIIGGHHLTIPLSFTHFHVVSTMSSGLARLASCLVLCT